MISSKKINKKKVTDRLNSFFHKKAKNEVSLGSPFGFKQNLHVDYNKQTGEFQVGGHNNTCHQEISFLFFFSSKGLPPEFAAMLKVSGISKEEAAENPDNIIKVLEFQSLIGNNGIPPPPPLPQFDQLLQQYNSPTIDSNRRDRPRKGTERGIILSPTRNKPNENSTAALPVTPAMRAMSNNNITLGLLCIFIT